jgi:hypothetical protein
MGPPDGASVPTVIATLTGWLAQHDLALGDLRTGRTLEEAYLAITGARGDDDPSGAAADAASSGRGSGRRHRGARR